MGNLEKKRKKDFKRSSPKRTEKKKGEQSRRDVGHLPVVWSTNFLLILDRFFVEGLVSFIRSDSIYFSCKNKVHLYISSDKLKITRN